jgi:Holliday junction resolvasome RuvABC endonuclease subunit
MLINRKINTVVMSIDPGIGGTGVAVWDLELWKTPKVNPLATYVLTPTGQKIWTADMYELFEMFDELLDKHNPAQLWCEYPQYFLGNHSATTEGNIYKLSSVVGMYMGMIKSRGGILAPVYVNEWKGQMSKDATIVRIKKRLPNIDLLNVKSHAWDAVGIGLYAQGLFGDK